MDSGLPRKVVGMSAADYFDRTDFLSRTYLCNVASGGGETQEFLDKGFSVFSGNRATTLGSRFDTLITGVCEGRQFSHIVVTPPADVLASNGARRGGKYDAWKAEIAAKGLIDCNADEAWQLEQMYDGAMACRAFRDLVEQTTETQVSVFFELNGHLCKVRPDGCTPTFWWDLKTTSQSWDKLFRSVGDYGYAEQEWLYVQGAMAVGMPHFRMPFAFVQTIPPFRCRVRTIPVEMVEEAGLRMTRVMEEIRLRRETGVYTPADADEITDITFPAWAMKREEEVITL